MTLSWTKTTQTFLNQISKTFIVIQTWKYTKKTIQTNRTKNNQWKAKIWNQNQITRYNKRERGTDLDIRGLEVDEHVVTNHKPNWSSHSKTPNTQYGTQNTHLNPTLTPPQIWPIHSFPDLNKIQQKRSPKKRVKRDSALFT